MQNLLDKLHSLLGHWHHVAQKSEWQHVAERISKLRLQQTVVVDAKILKFWAGIWNALGPWTFVTDVLDVPSSWLSLRLKLLQPRTITQALAACELFL